MRGKGACGSVALLIAVLTIATPAGASGPETPAICADPGNETFEQFIRRNYREADAVFSGRVRELTVERATVTVLETWKGELAAEVVMPTGVTINADGTYTIHGEVFSFRKGQRYVLFAFGKPRGRLIDSLATSGCEPNVTLAQAGATVGVLDTIVGKKIARHQGAPAAPQRSLSEIVACAAAGTCRDMKPGMLGWFDTVGHRVSQFSRDGFTYSLAAAGNLLRVWIALPGEDRPSRFIIVGDGGRVLRAEMGPIPGEGGPRRMSADELEAWRRSHKVFVGADPPEADQERGLDFFPFWQEQAARAWGAIQRQLNPPWESRAAAFETIVACVSDGNCRNARAGSVNWFDQINIPVIEFRDSDSVFAVRLLPSGRGLSIWITPAGERRPQRLVSVGAFGQVTSGELGPQPGTRNPQIRMTPEQSDAWRKAHRVYMVVPTRGQVVGEENRTYWEEEADSALAAIRRQLTGG